MSGSVIAPKKSSVLITLGHFCDKHGPTVLLVTQVGEEKTMGNELLVPDYPTDAYCESCSLRFPDDTAVGVKSMRSLIHEQSFVSTQYSLVRYQLLTLIIRKAFSEETMVYDGSPLVFYDNVRGMNLIMGFKLYDEHARGNERRYCLVFTIDSKDHKSSMKLLTDNWNFIEGGFKKMIQYIRQVHESENEKQCQLKREGDSLTPLVGNYLRANKVKLSRNLVELTKDKMLFLKLHKWNSYLISSIISSD